MDANIIVTDGVLGLYSGRILDSLGSKGRATDESILFCRNFMA